MVIVVPGTEFRKHAGSWSYIDDPRMWCKRGHQGCIKDGCWTRNPWQVWDNAGRTRHFIENTRHEDHLRRPLCHAAEPRVILRPGPPLIHEWWCEFVQDVGECSEAGEFCFHQAAVIVPHDWGGGDHKHEGYHGEDDGYTQCKFCGDWEIDPARNPLSWRAYRAARAEELTAKYGYPRELFRRYFRDLPLHAECPPHLP